jgi:hypothetical protein
MSEKRDEPVGILIRERPQKNAAHDGEDRRAGADPQRQRQDHQRGNAGSTPDLPQAVAKVATEIAQLNSPSLRAATGIQEQGASHPAKSL